MKKENEFFEEDEEGEEKISDSAELRATYICEDCDYRWEEKLAVDLKDTGPDLDLYSMKERISCPICGSHQVSLYED